VGGSAEDPPCSYVPSATTIHDLGIRDYSSGRKPLQPKHVWSIRVRLEIARTWHDLALFNLGIVLRITGNLINREGSVWHTASHSCYLRRGLAAAAIFMDGGKVVEEGPPAEVLDNPKTDRTRSFLRRIE
jgi:hypothetical protein